MSRTFKIYGAVLFLILLLIGLLELSKNPSLNWQKNFDPEQKSPFGLFVFAQEANQILNSKLRMEKMTPFDYYSDRRTTEPHNILIVQRSLDVPSWKKIHEQVAAGSTLFMAATDFPHYLKDTLTFRTAMTGFGSESTLKLTDKKLRKDSLFLDKLPSRSGFALFSKKHEILGSATTDEYEAGINFLKIPHGKGFFYLHSEPLFLTNYYLLKNPGSSKYAENVLGYLPDQQTVWFVEGKKSSSSAGELSFILSQPALRYAWWLFLAGLLIFAIFNIKRKQRRIPIIEPKRNKSVEFVQSIGNLYLQEGDFHEMMAKKAQYFLHHVRQDLMLDTTELNEEFMNKLQVKTGADPEKIRKAVMLIEKARNPYANVMKEDLFAINTVLDDILSGTQSKI